MIWMMVLSGLMVFLPPHAKRQTAGLKLLGLTTAVLGIPLWERSAGPSGGWAGHAAGWLASALLPLFLF